MSDIWAKPNKHRSVVVTCALLAVATLIAITVYADDTRYIPRRDFRSESDDNRGRQAQNPLNMPIVGWRDILHRTVVQIADDRLLAVAAGVVFYGLLALFPAITALVSSYALFADPKTIVEHMSAVSSVLPAGGYSVVEDQLNRVLAKGDAKLGAAFILSLLFAIWSANGGMKAIIDALNVVYSEKERRSFIVLNAVSLAFTAATLAIALVAIGLVVAVPILLNIVGLGSITVGILSYARWPALTCLMIGGLSVLYRYGPSRHAPQWKWISTGSVVATILWLTGSAALSYYLANYAGYDATYGSLGAAIGLMMWMWMSAIVILFGAELNSEIEHQTAVDTTTGAPKPMGARGAVMADTLGTAAA